MIIEDIKNYLTNDIDYYYTDIIDVKTMPQKIKFFATTPQDIQKKEYIRVTADDEEALIEIHTDHQELIKEAISYAKATNSSEIYVSIRDDAVAPILQKMYSLEYLPNHGSKDYGIYGSIDCENDNHHIDDAEVTQPDADDIVNISKLENSEWAFLPQRIKFLEKNKILIAKSGQKLLGYLIFDNGISVYNDICIVFVHKEYRKKGIGTLLVTDFANACKKRNEIPYYGAAMTHESFMFADRLHIPQIRKPNNIYLLK